MNHRARLRQPKPHVVSTKVDDRVHFELLRRARLAQTTESDYVATLLERSLLPSAVSTSAPIANIARVA